MASKTKAGPEQSSGRRNQILAIAAKLFAARGYSATTVRDIADEAGILSGSLYHHFSSKEAIAQEILRDFMVELSAAYDAILAEELSPSETLDRLVHASFDAIVSKTDSVGLYQNEALFLQTQPGFEFLGQISLRIEEIWREQLTRGQADGVFRASLDIPVLYRFIRDALWMTVRWFRPGGRHTAETLTAALLDVLHAGILAETDRT